jgi:hypothetical protein
LEDDNGNPGILEDEARQRIKWLVKDGTTIIKKDIQEIKLDGLPAARATIVYSCPNSSVELVKDMIFAAEPDGSLQELNLTAAKPAYESARKIFDQIAASWKLEKKKGEREFKKRLKEDSKAGQGERK